MCTVYALYLKAKLSLSLLLNACSKFDLWSKSKNEGIFKKEHTLIRASEALF